MPPHFKRRVFGQSLKMISFAIFAVFLRNFAVRVFDF